MQLEIQLVPSEPKAHAAQVAAPSGDATGATRASQPTFPWVPIAFGAAGLSLATVAIGYGVDAANANSALEARCGEDLICNEDPTFDPAALNDRKNLGFGLAVGLGAASAICIGIAIWTAVATKAKGPVTAVATHRRAALLVSF